MSASPPGPTDIVAPDVGAQGRPVTVGQWLVGDGEPVGEGDRVVELLCDGVLWNVSSPAGGTLASQDVPTRERVHAGQTLGRVTVNA